MKRYPAGSIGEILHAATDRLNQQGIDTARLDARVLMSHVLGKDPAWIIGHADEPITEGVKQRFEALASRREAYEPVAYLTGMREFWSLPFHVTPETLIPRPDTETLVAAALEVFKDGPPARILDLGTGCGCILLSLLSEWSEAQGTGVDIAKPSIAVAGINAAALDMAERAEFFAGDWQLALPADDAEYDLIVANPPYISEPEMADLPADVADFEPHRALAAGADGLDAYRRMAPALAELLRPGGFFLGEIGMKQADTATAILADAGLTVMEIQADAAGRPRCVVARSPIP